MVGSQDTRHGGFGGAVHGPRTIPFADCCRQPSADCAALPVGGELPNNIASRTYCLVGTAPGHRLLQALFIIGNPFSERSELALAMDL